MLHQLGCLLYSPALESHIRQLKPIKSNSKWEVELRGASIWCVELIRREIERRHPEVRPVQSTTNGLDNNVVLNGVRDESLEQEQGNESTKKSTSYGVNAVLIDFLLYDTMKQLELDRRETIPHHRTRSIWY
jgi:hypothetical protein